MYLFQQDNCQNYHSNRIIQIIRRTNYGFSRKNTGLRIRSVGTVNEQGAGNVPCKLQKVVKGGRLGLFVHLGYDLVHFGFCGAEFCLAKSDELGRAPDLLSQHVDGDGFRFDLFCNSCQFFVCFLIG